MLDERGEIRQKLCKSKATLKMRVLQEKEKSFERVATRLSCLCRTTCFLLPPPTTASKGVDGESLFSSGRELNYPVFPSSPPWQLPVFHRNHIRKALFLSVARDKTFPISQSDPAHISLEHRQGTPHVSFQSICAGLHSAWPVLRLKTSAWNFCTLHPRSKI